MLRRIPHPVLVLLTFTSLFIVFFSPVLFSSRILPSDGLISSFYSSHSLWTNYLFGGFPAAAESQSESWYPLCRLFALLPDGFNAFMVCAYVLASSFAYGYVFSLTRSRFAALVSGTVFGMSGFMMAHFGHTAMIQSALWLPLVIWSIEELRRGFSLFWFIIAVLSCSGSLLAGHPQITLYTCLLAAAYVLLLGNTAKNGRLKYTFACLAALALACGLAAIQLLPTLEFSRLTQRNKLSWDEFTSFSLPPQQLIHLIFPSLFGGISGFPDYVPYFGRSSSQELTGYVGILPLLLAAIGAWAFRKERATLFWSFTVVVTLLLVMGDSTPLARLLYHIPIINYFRGPARHFLEFGFASSVLAGIGVHAILTGKASSTLVRSAISAATLIVLISLGLVYTFYGRLQIAASRWQIHLSPIGKNRAVILPLVVFVLSIVALAFWVRLSSGRKREAALWIAVLLNMGIFGWFYEWRSNAVDRSIIHGLFMSKYKELLDVTRQRILPIGGVGGPPDWFRMYQLQSISGNDSLMLKRFAEFSGVTTYGAISPASLREPDRAVDLLAVQYVFQPISEQQGEQAATMEAHRIKWNSADLHILLGQGCNNTYADHGTLSLTKPFAATKVAIVSNLSCSTAVLDNQPVAEITLKAKDGTSESIVLKAGSHTSEWAYDRPAIPELIAKHRRAPIFTSWSFSGDASGNWEAHDYLSTFPLQRRDYESIELKWLNAPGVLDIHKISLIDEADNLTRIILPSDRPARFQHVETIGNITVSRNLSAAPRVWLVSDVLPATAEDILATIHTSRLPDGGTFEPNTKALVEEPLCFHVEHPDPDATASVIHMTDTLIEIQSSSRSPSFLVMSDVYYPGWKASVNGVDTHIFRTDYTLRGIALPAGGNMIRVEFKPFSFYLGATISIVTLMFILALSSVHLAGWCFRKIR